MYTLRPYQSEAVQAVIRFFRDSDEPAVVTLPTGAGKSLVIAELGRIAKGRVMVLTHVKELVAQNHGKYEALGLKGDIFSAGLKRKEASGKVVFGSVQSVARHLDKFPEEISLLIIDECHRVSEEKETQYQQVISHLRENNPNLKILGLTATPHRLGLGWIYRYHAQGRIASTEERFFHTCVYELPLQALLRDNYLTKPVVMGALAAQYHFGDLKPGPGGSFREEDLTEVIRNSKRATPRIIKQVMELMEEREGAMIFCATVEHAKEVMELLPNGEAAMILGNTKQKVRDMLIRMFKQKELKYMVNVSVLTTGFDAPHVDLIAILRPTESVSLFQQIVGRGMRLAPGKEECLILDYANNGYDIFSPEVGSPRPETDSVPVEVICPQCGFANHYWGKVDADGDIIEHYGRKCQGADISTTPPTPCDFRFRFRECEQCNAENDIAARQCCQCGAAMTDPDKALRDALGMKHAKVIRCGGMRLSSHRNKKGEVSLKVSYFDEDGLEMNEYFKLDSKAQKGAFYHRFVRMHHKAPGTPFLIESVEKVINQGDLFRHPDFVISYKEGKFWKVREKLFDYEGRFRKANEEY